MTDLGLFFLILNTLNFIQFDDYYCYCENLIKKENDVVSKPPWKSGHCQICKIPHTFVDFEQNINKNRFNIAVLCRYYDQLHGELVKLIKECPKAAECSLGGEYVTEIGTLENTGVLVSLKAFGILME